MYFKIIYPGSARPQFFLKISDPIFSHLFLMHKVSNVLLNRVIMTLSKRQKASVSSSNCATLRHKSSIAIISKSLSIASGTTPTERRKFSRKSNCLKSCLYSTRRSRLKRLNCISTQAKKNKFRELCCKSTTLTLRTRKDRASFSR